MAQNTPLEAPIYDPQSLPVQLPSKLTGREVLLAKIYGDLKNDDAVLLYGESGVGKTALAATLASAYSELPGGVIWLDTADTALETLIVQVARAYQRFDIANADNPLSHAADIKALLIEHKPLLVLDGLPDVDETAEFIERCASETPVLLTAPSALDGPWSTVALGPLDEVQATALVQHLTQLDESPALESLVKTLGGLPLALVIAAGAIKSGGLSPQAFLDAMPKAPGAAIAPPLLALTAAFKGLPSALQGLLLMLGATLNGQGSAELLSMISGAPVEGVNQAMGMLLLRHLVERYTRGGAAYYRLHPSVKDFAESWLRGSKRLGELQNKVRDSVVAYASRFTGQPLKLAITMDSFLTTAAWAAERDDLDTPNQIAVALMQAGTFAQEFGYTHEVMTLRRMAASTPAAAFPAFQQPPTQPAPVVEPDVEDDEFDDELDTEFEDTFEDEYDQTEDDYDDSELEDESDPDELDDLAEEDDLPLVSLGTPSMPPAAMPEPLPLDMGAMAQVRATLMQARQQGDRRLQAASLKRIAELQLSDGQETEALSAYAEALTHYEAVNDRGEMLNVLHALAELEAQTDNLQAAALHAARGAALADQLGELGRQAQILAILGDARQQLGESEPAIRAYEQALTQVRAANDARNEAVLLFKLGYAQLDGGSAQAASETWEKALKMFKEQGRRDYEGRVLGGLGTAYGDMERWMESINFHTSAFYIAREVGDKREEALQLNNLGYAAAQGKQLGQAVLRYRQALHLAYTEGEPDEVVNTTVELASVLIQSARHLKITQLLVDEALKLEPNDRDLRKLKERILTDMADAEARGVVLLEANGTAQEYALFAYQTLDES